MHCFFNPIYYVRVLLFILFTGCVPEHPLVEIMKSETPEIAEIAKNLDAHQVQIRYTQIGRDSMGQPQFHSYEYGVDESKYFYPASTAKLPVAALALQRLRELQKEGIPIDMHTPFTIWSADQKTPIAIQDTTHPKQQLTIAHLIKKIFLVSDNDAYNYLFDFLGRDYINAQLQAKGLDNIQIHHKFLFGADNANTWSYIFTKASDTVYVQKSISSKFNQTNAHLNKVKVGVGYIKDGLLVKAPMDFTQKNRLSIRDLEGIVKRVMFPRIFTDGQRFTLVDSDYEFLRYWMSRHTLESESPRYTEAQGYYDSYVKFFIYGDRKGVMVPDLRIFNKVGDAYGTLTDTAYIVNTDQEIEFLLTATVFVNANGIFNDDTYEYDKLGFPFLAELGRQVYLWEQKRKQAHRPAFKK